MKRGGPLRRRTPLARGESSLRRSPIQRRRSERVRRRDRDLPEFRRVVHERAGYVCEWPGCTQPSTDAHHKRPVSLGGTNDPDNGAALCRMHHHHVEHDGRVEARRLDLLR